MVKLVHSVSCHTHTSAYGKWLIWGALVVLLAGVSMLVFPVLLHDALDDACGCVLCAFNRVPKESEYIYNRYLPVISVVWLALLVLLMYAVRYCMNKWR